MSRPTDAQLKALRVVESGTGFAEVWNDPKTASYHETFAYVRVRSGEVTIRMPTLRAMERDGLMERRPWEGRHERSWLTDAGRHALAEQQREGRG